MTAVTVELSGRFAYVATYVGTGGLQGSIVGYSINPNGTLTSIPWAPFPVGVNPSWVTTTGTIQ